MAWRISPAVHSPRHPSSRRRLWWMVYLDLRGSTQASCLTGHPMSAGVKSRLAYRTRVSRRSLSSGEPHHSVRQAGHRSAAVTSIRDYLDPQFQMVGNAGWTKGAHNVKFGVDAHRMHMNHNETQNPTFNFNGGLTALSGGASPNNFNSMADFLLGLPSARSATAMSPLVDTSGGSQERPATLRSWEVGFYIRDQFQLTQKMTASVGLRWEYLPDVESCRPWSGDVRFHDQSIADLWSCRRTGASVQYQSPEGSVYAKAWVGL